MALALQQVTPIARRVLAWWNGVDPPEGVAAAAAEYRHGNTAAATARARQPAEGDAF